MANSVTPPMHLPPSTPVPPLESKREHSRGSRRHSTGSNNHMTYAETWAADVQNYHAAKSILPWLPEQHEPVKYVTRYEKAREEREYDIVLGRFRDEDKEVGYQEREGAQFKQALEKGRAKQLRTIQRFHMISNAPMYPGAKDPTEKWPEQHPNRKKGAAAYNIITNIPHTGEVASTPTTSVSPSRKPYREFNVLTNKYHDRHDVRFEQEAAQAKRLAAQKYFKTRTFDPVRITYVDEDREKEFLIHRHDEQQIHGKDRILLLPPREQFSEGRLYNILNQRVINPEKLVTMNEKDQRALNKMKKTAYEKQMREVGENQQARETDLCFNRYAHERHIQSHIHGYDVLSNQSYAGRDAKPIVHPRTRAALSGWQTIESGLLVSNRIPPKSSGTVANARLPPNTAPAKPAVRDDASTTKTNILVLDKPQIQSLKSTPSSSAVMTSDRSQSIVRTGGFRAG